MLNSGNKDIKKLFSKILFIAIIVSALDFTIGKTLKHFYFTQTSGLHYRTTYAMDSTHADILIFGSSRANHHYDTRILSDSLGMSCYNTGRDGNFLLYNYAVFETIMERYTPKIVIFDINRNELSSTSDDYERLSSLLPYKNRNNVIDKMIALSDLYVKVKCLSKIYPFNSLLLTIAIGNTTMNKSRKSDINGYVPLTGTWKSTNPDTDSSSNGFTDPNKLMAITEIINKCKTRGIRLVFVNSPVFINYAINSDNNSIKVIALNNKLEYLDYSEDSIFLNNHTYFVDPGHLNEIGARLFTENLVEYLKDESLVLKN